MVGFGTMLYSFREGTTTNIRLDLESCSKGNKGPTSSTVAMHLIWTFCYLVVSAHLKNISQHGNLPQNRGETNRYLKQPPTKTLQIFVVFEFDPPWFAVHILPDKVLPFSTTCCFTHVLQELAGDFFFETGPDQSRCKHLWMAPTTHPPKPSCGPLCYGTCPSSQDQDQCGSRHTQQKDHHRYYQWWKSTKM